MDEFNRKITNCYYITNEVISKYRILHNMMVNYAFKDSSVYECYVDDVKKVVLREYNMYRELSFEEIDICLKFLENNCNNDSKINDRFQRKLEILKDIYCGNKITGMQVGLDYAPSEIEFNLFDSIISLIDIEMMKIVRSKLDNLKIDNNNDLMFVKLMYQRFNATLFAQVVDNNLTEIVGLFNDMDVSKFPMFDVDNMIKIINDKYMLGGDNSIDEVNLTFLNLAKITIDRLSLCGFSNNSQVVFDNLAFITRIEVLIRYMNINSLYNLLEYCLMYRDKNMYGIDKVIKLVKNKLK